MRRTLLLLAMTVSIAATAAASAYADGTYHSHHYALHPVAAAPLRSGFVENIHPNGPNVFAHEQYVLNGARPATDYQVVLSIFPGDTSCTGAPPLVLTTATITTNSAGNGSADHVFTPSDAAGLRGMTLGAIWRIERSGTADYATDCETVQLD
jgi:hypothetical protein